MFRSTPPLSARLFGKTVQKSRDLKKNKRERERERKKKRTSVWVTQRWYVRPRPHARAFVGGDGERERKEKREKYRGGGVLTCVCVCVSFFSGEKCVPSRVRSSGTRWGPASAHQLTARAPLRPSNTSAHEPANNSLKLMHAPHYRMWCSPNGRHGNSSGKISGIKLLRRSLLNCAFSECVVFFSSWISPQTSKFIKVIR